MRYFIPVVALLLDPAALLLLLAGRIGGGISLGTGNVAAGSQSGGPERPPEYPAAKGMGTIYGVYAT